MRGTASAACVSVCVFWVEDEHSSAFGQFACVPLNIVPSTCPHSDGSRLHKYNNAAKGAHILRNTRRGQVGAIRVRRKHKYTLQNRMCFHAHKTYECVCQKNKTVSTAKRRKRLWLPTTSLGRVYASGTAIVINIYLSASHISCPADDTAMSPRAQPAS